VNTVASGAHVVAIDGPSGTGKSTVGRAVADELGLKVLDTGAMYRAITLAVLAAGVAPDDADACVAIARAVDVYVEEGVTRLDGRDVSTDIRGPDVTAAVSAVSAHAPLRRILVDRQREWVAGHDGGVVEGRDIGTVVFPNAAVKVFLVADERERARRRQRDEADLDRMVGVDAVEAALARRDALDRGRATSPLKAADDAIVIDTTHRGVDDIAAEIAKRYREAG
jgi:cytidylate kinase